MWFDITDKRVIVTGGAQGIGEASVRALCSGGARVVSFDVRDDSGQAVATDATTTGPGWARYRHVDITQRHEVAEGVAWAAAELDGLDAVLNIAGIERRAALEEMTEEELDSVLAVNVKGTLFMCQAAFPFLKERGGSIMNVGSDAGLKPYPFGSHYSASKGAVMAFTRTVAHEWGRYNIRVNSLVPAMWTPMGEAYFQRLDDEARARLESRLADNIVLGGTLGDPATDLAPVVVFLVSDASKFITGQIIAVNGGNESVR
jgi:NAD(P)-dependent dehydrogenase (short-subunit alcohol dehydrogenase family)